VRVGGRGGELIVEGDEADVAVVERILRDFTLLFTEGRTPTGSEMREAFRQLDILLKEAGVDRNAICTARLYLHNVIHDVPEVNVVWKEYFGDHPVVRRCYGVVLQSGMRVEAAFTAEIP